jgi:hypothetical protein
VIGGETEKVVRQGMHQLAKVKPANDKSQLNRLIVEEISVSYLIDWLAAKLIDETYRKRENTPQI